MGNAWPSSSNLSSSNLTILLDASYNAALSAADPLAAGEDRSPLPVLALVLALVLAPLLALLSCSLQRLEPTGNSTVEPRRVIAQQMRVRG
eukprot:CAMPEP_0181253390 /NCGR_PEP_ID=MMETSP1096-20121128/47989_1 /TAXON_ID=156174 ORGANISM="Chrysochromulina ericina, Strain CCMP281" /NCGR_SAMPLE_ID=MMETSP1096 /ASSEMBLY_ACC=CAM_ASM_000453 /LENGTH=90 /DNA_ID=CAMNT_0023351245 /DNA_START=325 /DNA_END=597 /DNA_ORIENTATION=+